MQIKLAWKVISFDFIEESITAIKDVNKKETEFNWNNIHDW